LEAIDCTGTKAKKQNTTHTRNIINKPKKPELANTKTKSWLGMPTTTSGHETQ